MNNNHNVLAIDIGGTSIKIGVVRKNEVIDSASIRNSFKGNFKYLLPTIKGIIDNYLTKYHINKIGIGCPGDITDGYLHFASNLGWKNINIFNKNWNNNL